MYMSVCIGLDVCYVCLYLLFGCDSRYKLSLVWDKMALCIMFCDIYFIIAGSPSRRARSAPPAEAETFAARACSVPARFAQLN